MGYFIRIGDSYPTDVVRPPMSDPSCEGSLQLVYPERFGWLELQNPEIILVTGKKIAEELQGVNADEVSNEGNRSPSTFDTNTEPEARNWVSLPHAPDPDVETVWHYTNSEATIGIVSTCSMWATSVSFLNDRKEVEYGFDVLNELLEEIRISAHLHPSQKEFILDTAKYAEEIGKDSPLFVLCASEVGDSLSQWRSYGGSPSTHQIKYCIGIDSNSMGIVIGSKVDLPSQRKRVGLNSWTRVLYDKNAQIELLKQSLGYCAFLAPPPGLEVEGQRLSDIREFAASNLLETLVQCKHPSFSEEKEVRMLFSVPLNSRAIRHRKGNFGIVPYIEISVRNSHDEYLEASENEPIPVSIQTIMVGPCSEIQMAESGLQSLLIATGNEGIKVKRTNSPYR